MVDYQVAEAIRGLRFLFLESSAPASDKHLFASELDELCFEQSEMVCEAALVLYESVRDGLRRGLMPRIVVLSRINQTHSQGNPNRTGTGVQSSRRYAL